MSLYTVVFSNDVEWTGPSESPEEAIKRALSITQVIGPKAPRPDHVVQHPGEGSGEEEEVVWEVYGKCDGCCEWLLIGTFNGAKDTGHLVTDDGAFCFTCVEKYEENGEWRKRSRRA